MYKLIKDPRTNNNVAVDIIDKNTSIPLDPANSDYQQFLKDLAEDVELLDAEGNPADQGTIKAFLRG